MLKVLKIGKIFRKPCYIARFFADCLPPKYYEYECHLVLFMTVKFRLTYRILVELKFKTLTCIKEIHFGIKMSPLMILKTNHSNRSINY